MGIRDWLKKCEENSYAVFYETEGKKYNLNIVGWRNRLGRVNCFDDTLAVYWQDSGQWNWLCFPITTRPGLPWLRSPMNHKGTAILVPGQYRNAYAIGQFKSYTALRQVRPVRVFRDSNKDSVINTHFSSLEEGLFGIHIHKAGAWSRIVGPSSAGCQVFQKSSDFEKFIGICQKSAEYWGNRFTYTLLEM